MRYVSGALIAALVVLEAAARLAGFGATLAYETTAYGYRVKPNQAITRMGNAIYYNDLGLRNATVAALPAEGVTRILCIGDSITYGGTQADQEQTYPYQLQKLLATAPPGINAEVLNASAGGWATENEEGWLEAHGVFGAQWVILQVATHDLFQPRSGAGIVGNHPSFPSGQPWFALQEVVTRYAIPMVGRLAHDPGVEIQFRSADDVRRVLSSINRIEAMVRRSNARLAVLLVEQPKGIEPTDPLTVRAKAQLSQQLTKLEVPLIRPSQDVEQAGGVRLFRDGLHPNAEGNRVLARALLAFLATTVQSVQRTSFTVSPSQTADVDDVGDAMRSRAL
jgi:lysophospholipase L1-like esterase